MERKDFLHHEFLQNLSEIIVVSSSSPSFPKHLKEISQKLYGVFLETLYEAIS